MNNSELAIIKKAFLMSVVYVLCYVLVFNLKLPHLVEDKVLMFLIAFPLVSILLFFIYSMYRRVKK